MLQVNQDVIRHLQFCIFFSFVNSFSPRLALPTVGNSTVVPPMKSSLDWEVWKPLLTNAGAKKTQWNYELAYYIYCKLNHA